jgi:hypothetical protein
MTDKFLADLANTVDNEILRALTAKLNSFSLLVCEMPEMKEKAVTPVQIIDLWNQNSTYKIKAGVTVEPAPAASAKPKAARAKTDKDRKCQVPKTKGESAGQPCGHNCVVDQEYCPEHLKKMQKTSSVKETAETASSDGSEEKSGCQHELVNGPRKGMTCGKPVKDRQYCKVHGEKHPE